MQRVNCLLKIQARQGLEGPALGGLRNAMERVGSRGTPESPLHIKAPQKSIGKRRTNAKHVFFLVVECVWLVSE